MFEAYDDEIFHLARLGLAGRRQDIQMFIRRLSRKVRDGAPDLSERLLALLADNPSPDSPVRSATMAAMPVDQDSRLQLLRTENPVHVDFEPIWPEELKQRLAQIVRERERLPELEQAKLFPTRSVLFFGAPGVGKTLAARWLASRLHLPLLILDLSAVMSSFLGRTGSNVRSVFDYAKGTRCVLLLDEMDAIAKRRDDVAELGELKRLVTVLNQEIDDWPPASLLLGATNHPDLLDPAVWRRFDMVLEFPAPSLEQTEAAVRFYLGNEGATPQPWHKPLAHIFAGVSYSEIERELVRLRRIAVLDSVNIEHVVRVWATACVSVLPRSKRHEIAKEMTLAGIAQRQVHEWTGVSRDTIRNFSSKAMSDKKQIRGEE